MINTAYRTLDETTKLTSHVLGAVAFCVRKTTFSCSAYKHINGCLNAVLVHRSICDRVHGLIVVDFVFPMLKL